MMLTKNEREHKLEKHIERLDRVLIRLDHFDSIITQLTVYDILQIIKKDPDLKGVPQAVAIDNNILIFFPKPDKNYNCTVLGQITIEQ